MNEIVNDIELNESFKPRRNPLLFLTFDSMLPYFLIPLAMFSLGISISMAFRGINFFVMHIAGFPVAFLLILAIWIVSMPVIGLFLWKPHFVNSLFSLLAFNEFRASQVMILIAVMASRVLFITVRDGNLSYRKRMAILVACIVLITVNIFITATCISASGMTGQFYYVYAVEFIVFELITVSGFKRNE